MSMENPLHRQIQEFLHFNMPIGYFSDTSNIISEITENNILLTYIYSDNTNQTLNLSYEYGDKSSYLQITLFTTMKIVSNISYSIENSFSPTFAKNTFR